MLAVRPATPLQQRTASGSGAPLDLGQSSSGLSQDYLSDADAPAGPRRQSSMHRSQASGAAAGAGRRLTGSQEVAAGGVRGSGGSGSGGVPRCVLRVKSGSAPPAGMVRSGSAPLPGAGAGGGGGPAPSGSHKAGGSHGWQGSGRLGEADVTSEGASGGMGGRRPPRAPMGWQGSGLGPLRGGKAEPAAAAGARGQASLLRRSGSDVAWRSGSAPLTAAGPSGSAAAPAAPAAGGLPAAGGRLRGFPLMAAQKYTQAKAAELRNSRPGGGTAAAAAAAAAAGAGGSNAAAAAAAVAAAALGKKSRAKTGAVRGGAGAGGGGMAGGVRLEFGSVEGEEDVKELRDDAYSGRRLAGERWEWCDG